MNLQKMLLISEFSLFFETCYHKGTQCNIPIYQIQNTLMSWKCSFCLFWPQGYKLLLILYLCFIIIFNENCWCGTFFETQIHLLLFEGFKYTGTTAIKCRSTYSKQHTLRHYSILHTSPHKDVFNSVLITTSYSCAQLWF